MNKNIEVKRISVLHINHNYRQNSVRDESLVREVCDEWNLKLYVENLKPIKISKNVEEYLRDKRFEIFKKYIEDYGFTKIALGHTADDFVENFLLRMLRGSGLHGLTEMGLVGWNGRIIRPLLNYYKDEILDFLKRNRIEYVVDETNLESEFLRNKLRNKLIPFVEREICPDFKGRIVHLGGILEIEREFNLKWSGYIFDRVCTVEEKCIVVDVKSFRNLLRCERLAVLREILHHFKGNYRRVYFKNYVEMDEFILNSRSGGVKKLGGSDIYFIKEFDRVKVLENYVRERNLKEDFLEIIPPSEIFFNGEHYRLKLVGSKDIKNSKNSYFFPFALSDKIVFRKRRKGDVLRFKFGRKKLKKFFCEKKVGLTERDDITIICDGSGEIIWIPQLGYKFNLFNDRIYGEFILMERNEDE